jgi:hypothetical protein
MCVFKALTAIKKGDHISIGTSSSVLDTFTHHISIGTAR